MGKLLTCLPRLSLAQLRLTLRSTSAGMCSKGLNFSHRPQGAFPTCPNRLSSFNSDQSLVLPGRCACQPHLQTSHRPNGRLAFCSLFAGWWCLCRGWHSVNREFPDLLQHSKHCARSSSKVCIAPMRLTFCSLFAGRWCPCRARHSVNRELPDLLQHSDLCARCDAFEISHRPDGNSSADLPNSTLIFQLGSIFRSTTGTKCTCQPRLQNPIAPMGCLADIPTSTLVLDDGCCLDLPVWGACHLHLKLQKFPWPQWDFHMFCTCACRAAVSSSRVAQ